MSESLKTEDEKIIENLLYVYMMIMSEENSFGMDLAATTLKEYPEEEFKKVISVFREEKELEKTIKSILMAIRELNKINDNEATTLAIINVVKTKIDNLKSGFSFSKSESKS